MFKLLCTAALLFSIQAHAEKEMIEFSADELASESVMPVFDKTSVVKNRKIKTQSRFEMGAGLGLNLGEALYQQMTYNFNLAYHLSELQGINLTAIMTQQGLSNMGSDLRSGKGLVAGSFDASLAPSPEYYLIGNYQYTAYYGKMSVTKQTVMNLMLYGLLGLGTVSFGDSNSILLNTGLGQKIYFSERFSLRFDLQLAMYEGPDPTQPKVSTAMTTGSPALSSDDFEATLYFRSFLSLTGTYLF